MKNTRNAATSTHIVLMRVDDVVGLQRRRRLAEHRGPGLGAEVPGDRPHAGQDDPDGDHLAPEVGNEVLAHLLFFDAFFDTDAQGIDHEGEDKEPVFPDRSPRVTGTGLLSVGHETRI